MRACRVKDVPGLRGLSQADVCAAAQERLARVQPRLRSVDLRCSVSLSFLTSMACAAVTQPWSPRLHVSAAGSGGLWPRSGAACQAASLVRCGLAARNAHWSGLGKLCLGQFYSLFLALETVCALLTDASSGALRISSVAMAATPRRLPTPLRQRQSP